MARPPAATLSPTSHAAVRMNGAQTAAIGGLLGHDRFTACGQVEHELVIVLVEPHLALVRDGRGEPARLEVVVRPPP